MSHAESDATPIDLLSLDRQLCFALYSASLAMTKLYKPLLAPLGLTYPQYLVMMVLWEHQDLTVNDLGKRLQLDSGTLTPLLKRLETAGLVQRQRDQEDERRVRITLTSKGCALKDQAQSVPKSVGCQVNLTNQELMSLRTTLTELRERLNQG
ncbi:MarR family winged helix-turn-helix transcriptional regulator [Aquabacterium sp.]|uniref:MarR family winged helix-turn-helix transcriptional regulator n=1 Tax=Aquabacterium sp. TaxID=1872578 RepID=UPI003D6CBB73